ncbi:hypothetical protein CLV56_0262 [Mumia flava]|uniref:Uncharacterized protein n=1 Tax=Mumia flava TaxID=1348852 RepID=A0A0B2B2L2_9ACTN|nr:hypothetical protein [Mumia flava]PJJ56058.1 hypothetical protein CLV56_0262 [Mumia flava]
MTAPPGGDAVGSLLEEAVKLARVLAEDAGRAGTEDTGRTDGTASAHERGTSAEEAGGGGGPAGPHTASSCALCPLCQLITLLREARPEVADHLASAAASLALALRGVVDSFSQPPGSGAGEHGRDRGVQDIDLEDGGWD